MANKLIRPEQFLDHIAKKQGDRSDSQFARETGVARQSIYRLRAKNFLPSLAILRKLGMEVLYRDVDVVPVASKNGKPKKK